VIFSIKDIYNESPEKTKKRTNNTIYGSNFDSEDIEVTIILVNTLNLKSKRLLYVSNLPSSFGLPIITLIIVEWSKGFYQMHVDIEELNGKTKNTVTNFFDINVKIRA
jgi:hypothetical protein